jgi:outer membrane protein assembly factor BamB
VNRQNDFTGSAMPSRIVSSAISCVLVCTMAVLVAQAPSLDYTQWRGAQRDGAASGFKAPTAWPDKLTRRWKVTVGEGYATPLVVGGRIYTFTRVDGEEVMTSLNADTGERLWRTGYPAPYTPGDPAKAHGAGPKATPLFHEGRLFTLGISGIVAAFDPAAGSLLWKTAPPAEAPYFSASSSPVGDGGVVIVHPGNYGPLTAFDIKTGGVKWTAGDDGLFASPIITEIDGVRQAISLTQQNLIGVSVPDGRVLWRHPFANNGGITPVIYRDTIIISGLDRGVAAIKPAKRGAEWVVDKVWDTKDVSMYLSNPVVIGDTLFGLSHRASGQFFAIDAKTGKTLWLGAPRQAANTAVVKAGEFLFLLNDDAELIVARNNRGSFEPLKRYQVADSATWAQPAISGNRLFVKDATSLTLWTLE